MCEDLVSVVTALSVPGGSGRGGLDGAHARVHLSRITGESDY